MRAAFRLVDTDMVNPLGLRGTGLPLIRTVQRTLPDKDLDVILDRFRVVRRNRRRLDVTVVPDDARDVDRAGSNPAAFVLSGASSSGFISCTRRTRTRPCEGHADRDTGCTADRTVCAGYL
jgi:hypothetical protein